jgi:hypothetical protein
MARQTLSFVALPHTDTGRGRLLLSSYMTPRLESGATLAAFPDILNWTQLLHDHGMEFTFVCNGQTVKVPIDSSVLRPDIWREIFMPHCRVAPYQLGDYDRRLFVSYPAREAMSFVKYAYQQVSLATLRKERESRFLGTLLRNLTFRNEQGSTLDATLSQLRLELWREQNDQPRIANTLRSGGIGGASGSPHTSPDGIPTSFAEPPGTRQMISRFALFHHMPPAPHRPPLPQTEADFAQAMDFHQALTALSSYPTVMRALGLVFDFELPESFFPYSPNVPGADYLTIAVQRVTPGFGWTLRPKYFLPQTAYYRNGSSFAAAPATPSGDLATGNYLVGDVVDGALALAPNFFHLVEVDLDGTLLKVMALADNALNARPSLEIEETLPAVRSAGIALMSNTRALQVLQSVLANKQFDAALNANAPVRAFNVRDLVRGYRIDIWSSQTGVWRSLHRRHATYTFGSHGTVELTVPDEEGFTQLAASQPADDPTRKPDPIATQNGAPQPGADIFIHERIAKWTGWSLSVQRPGGALNRSADPGVATDQDPTVNEPRTPFKMVSSFLPIAASLPSLRFGVRYRMRVRAVDLAGNSVPLQHQTASALCAPIDSELPYLRFEPVAHPVLVLRQPLKAGATLDRLVIRTYNHHESLDTVPTKEVDERHVAPPKVAVRMAEQHGMFDDAQGKLKGDKATYDMIVARDKGELHAHGDVPIDQRAQLPLPYFPDPIARGAAFLNLPNTPDNTRGELHGQKLRYDILPDVQAQPGSVTLIPFGDPWPNRLPFRIVAADGELPPSWDSQTRVLTIRLPKAEFTVAPLSCFLGARDLSLMGIWNWLREYLETAEAIGMQSSSASFAVPEITDAFALLTRLILEGGHPMITPSKPLTLVHAVQQPIGRPEFVLLPVIHQPAQPIVGSALHNGFSPVTAWRSLQSHHAFLLGGLRIHGKSTSQIDLEAFWDEYSDSPAKPLPTVQRTTGTVETIDTSSLAAGQIAADASLSRYVASYIPVVDTLWFSAPFDQLPGVVTPTTVAAPMHKLPDTKHRWVYYQAVATSRFREYFAEKDLTFTRTSDSLLVNVPSSARPVAPEIAYIVPTFGIERQETSNVKTFVRFGNGVRVYLQRPWFSSGQDELLGALLWPQASATLTNDEREKYKHYITQWGLDPIWQGGSLPEIPASYVFPNAVRQGQGLTLEETSLTVDVAGHAVSFDEERKLWFCDITFENPTAYTPFVRLVLARYQPHSIPGVELSHAVLADFTQLSPDRAAVLSVDPADPRRSRVFVGGLAPQGPIQSYFTVIVEKRVGRLVSDLAWTPAPNAIVGVAEDAPVPDQPDAALWSGTVTFAQKPESDQYRVVIQEYELLPRDATESEILAGTSAALGSRIVYAAIIPYNFPSAASN